jgi:glycosyltransferase involved in cell wall biosynthesis
MNVKHLRDVDTIGADWRHLGVAVLPRPQPLALPLAGRRSVAILLSTYNGESFLPAQLRSYLSQVHDDWTLHWRDDGSTDASVQVVAQFAAEVGHGRCIFRDEAGQRRATSSFLALLRAARGSNAAYFAFSDQDDVWLPDKLERGVTALDRVSGAEPALYCAGRILVDAELRRQYVPGGLHRPPGFPAALTQNVAPGCTMMLNRAAADLVLASQPPETTWHDWWCYLIVAAAGGHLLIDRTATVLYRQHTDNWVGEYYSLWQRGIAALRRGPRPFMRLLRQHAKALMARPDLLTDDARHQLSVITHGLENGLWARATAIRLSGFARQTWLENLVFRLWFMFG